MKAGVNRTDLKTVNRLFEQGETAEFISTALQIDLSVIENYMPKEKEKVGKSSKSKLADTSKG